MEFHYAYHGHSSVSHGSRSSAMAFAPDTRREPTFFRGQLGRPVAFREAISALNDVVVSDLRFVPKDRSAYKAWLAQQELVDWADVSSRKRQLNARIERLRKEQSELYQRERRHWAPYYRAQSEYFDYLLERDYQAWLVLDPVITVHPDEIFFECFSKDESTYGRLGCSYEVFKNIGEFACGTTNIDYSEALYKAFQKLRTYRTTHLEVDASGFEVQTKGQDTLREVKIDLPDSWVRGFLQVNSAMALPAVQVELHPMDLHSMCLVLRRRREVQGPRAMRYELTPGEPVKVVFEPWEHEVVCHRSIYKGDTRHVIRTWGRRRIHVLERLIPEARKFTVHLLGRGLPSFYVADLGAMSFTLGLSGWTSNAWADGGRFDLMAPRADVDVSTAKRVYDALKNAWYETPDVLSERLELDRAVVLGALGGFTQAGKAIFDLNKSVYRARELSRDPLPLQNLRWSSPREAEAAALVERNAARVDAHDTYPNGHTTLAGSVRDGDTSRDVMLTLDSDQRLHNAECSCSWYVKNRLHKGPCTHMLALRMHFERRKS